MQNINGPTNFFRLKNKEKDIYIFFDRHVKLEQQKKCNKYLEINHDMDNFLAYSLTKNIDKQFDLLIELNKDNAKKFKNDIYIVNVLNLHNKLKKNNNIRTHFVDIRDTMNLRYMCEVNDLSKYLNSGNIENLFSYFNYLEMVFTPIVEYITNFKDYEDLNKLNVFLNKYKINKKSVNILNKIINKKKYNNPKIYDILIKEFEYYVTNKLIYLLESVKKMRKELENINVKLEDCTDKDNTFFNKNKKTCEKVFTILNKYQYDYYMKISFELYDKIEEFYENACATSSRIMDFYCLRRILDKDYMKNIISYTGGEHSSFYLYILLKYFDFEVLEYGFINDKLNSNDLIKLIKKSKDFYDVRDYTLSDKTFQCVKIHNLFEKN